MSDDEYYRYAEKCLYGYRRNEERAEQLREELRQLRDAGDVKAQSYGLQNSGAGGYSDPVGMYVENIERAEHALHRLERKVKPIARLRNDLQEGSVITVTSPHNLIRVMEEYFFENKKVMEFLRITRWGRSTFFNRRYELVSLTLENLRE